MIGDDAKGDVDFLLLVLILYGGCVSRRRLTETPYNRQQAGAFLAAQFFNLIENWAEDIGLVIRNCSGKIAEILGALNDCDGALETHSGIDMARCQWHILGLAGVTAPGYRLCVELDEHQIPNLDAARVVFVHKCAARIAIWREIDMHLRARSARAGVAHHPKIVGLAAAENVNLWIKVGFAEQTRPVIVRFLVKLAGLAGAGLINGRVKPLCRKFP